MVTSAYSIGSAPSELSMVSVTSARPSGARPDVPAKITSSIFPARSAFAPCSPSTQLIASTTLDLPDPLGPTTQVIPGSRRSVVAEAKDLKPFSVRLLRCTGSPGNGGPEGYRDPADRPVGRLRRRTVGGMRPRQCAPVRCPASAPWRDALFSFIPTMLTVVPRAAYRATIASSTATLEASQTWAADRSTTT